MENQKTKAEVVLDTFRPKKEKIEKSELSGFKPKDNLFTKKKTYIDKSTKQEVSVEADWRKFCFNGEEVVLIKGQELSKQEYSLFGGGAKDYFVKVK